MFRFSLRYKAGALAVCLWMLVSCSGKRAETGSEHLPSRAGRDSIVRLDSIAVALVYADPESARRLAGEALALALRTESPGLLIKSLNVKGLVLSVHGNDSARWFLDRALGLSASPGAGAERGSIFYNIASIYLAANDFRNARVMLDSSVNAALRSGDVKTVCVSLIAMGSICNSSDDTASARRMYDSALVLAKRHHLLRETGIATGNLAHYKTDEQATASGFREAVQLLRQVPGTESEQASFLMDLGVYQRNPDSALILFREALSIARAGGIRTAEIAILNNMAYTLLDLGRPAEAADCLNSRAIPLAAATANHDWLSTLYDSYADVLMAQKKPELAVENLRKSVAERGEADRIMAKKQVRLLNALLDLNNKNLMLLEKDREISLRNIRIDRMKFWLAIAASLILASAVFLLWFRQRSQSRMQELRLTSAKQIIEAGEHEKETFGRELHDALGTLGIRVSAAFIGSPGADEGLKTAVKAEIAAFYNEMRTLSHRMNRTILEHHAAGELIDSLCRESMLHYALRLEHSVTDSGRPVASHLSLHLYRIVQELLANARKHAPGAALRLMVNFGAEQVSLEYSDDGPGLDPVAIKGKGLGISNIFARATLIGGTVTLDSVPGHGLYVKIDAPADFQHT